jgi:predicted dehydrogenase
MDKVRWGILSTANIGLAKVVPAMQQGAYCAVRAIASRRLGQAQEAARRLGIPRAYGSYEQLLADPEIDAIYNPLPNHLHVPWSLKALEAGKHVLCEKPLAPSLAEEQQLYEAAHRYPRLKVMEAFMYRHHPQWQRAREMVLDDRIGPLRTIQAFFSYYLDDPGNIRNIAEFGGGGMLDIGCYTVSLARFLFGAEPRRVLGIVEFDPLFQTDRLASALLDFGTGTSTFTCSTQLSPYQRVHVFGTRGRIEIEIPFNAPANQPTRLFYQHGDEIEEIHLPACDQYTIQGDLFSQAILNNHEVPTPLDDALANQRTIEAILRSARDGTWVQP